MLTLQAITTKQILENININDETSPIIEEFLLNYLNNNKKLLNKCLDHTGLYHVYFRQEDPFVSDSGRQRSMILLKSFTTEHEAVQWIIDQGRQIVKTREEEYAENSIVLTIIPTDNTGDYYHAEEPTRLCTISTEKYLNFAFSSNGYKMLLSEHMYAHNFIWSEHNPTWFHYYKEDGTHIIGASIAELQNIGANEDLIQRYQ